MKLSIEAYKIINEALAVVYEDASDKKKKEIYQAQEELDEIGTY